ncbi:MAG: hypothetical protein WBE76_04980 [Terracidiphilus sp.]
MLAWCLPLQGQVNVIERGYNKFRTGANTAETILTPATVNSAAKKFHKQFVMRVDGRIEAFPLYVSNVEIAGGTHNVVYVATMHNTVFASVAPHLRPLWDGIPRLPAEAASRTGPRTGWIPNERHPQRCAASLKEMDHLSVSQSCLLCTLRVTLRTDRRRAGGSLF